MAVSSWDFYYIPPNLSITGSSSSLGILMPSPAALNDMHDPAGNPSYLLTANDFYDSAY